MDSTSNGQHYMKRSEVAALFGVHPATVDRWAHEGKFGHAAFKTPGGQWRYLAAPVKVMARQSDPN
jgi:predicted site-specific integrase-resolvase